MSKAIRLLTAIPAFILAAILGGCLASAQGIERQPLTAAGSERQAHGLARPATYDPAAWFKVEFWGREWPDGFTVDKDITLPIRAKPEIGAQTSVSCALRKGATYHPWNTKRVKADRLAFVTFTRIRTYALLQDHSAELTKLPGNEPAKMNFARGDQWSLIGPGSEGFFMLRVGGDIYQADQDMFEVSAEMGATDTRADKDGDFHQWLRLTCANGKVGWIFYEEIKGMPGLSQPEECGESCAEDRKPARRRSPTSPSGTTR